MIRVLTSLITVLTVGILNAQSVASNIPKLIVGISVDQLRGDYLEYFMKSFGEKGFKKMLNSGVVYSDMVYSFPNLNCASALATVYTGSNPSVHSIISPKVYNSNYLKEEDIFLDDNYLGNIAVEKVSPKSINGYTLTDVLKNASNGISNVYSLAPEPFQALIMGGNLGNGAFWVDNNSGKWASSSFYTYLTPYIEQVNGSVDSYSNFVWNNQWKPLRKIELSFPYTKTQGDFNHYLASDNQPIGLSKKTPFINEYICNTAIGLIEKGGLGNNVSPDFLSLVFYAGSFPKSNEYGNEVEDLYLRLDKDIEKLLDCIDKNIGLQNTLIFLYSTGYYEYNDKIDNPENIFQADRNAALLNMYLMAIYGQGENWVEKFYDNQIFLNKALIEKKGIDLSKIRKDVSIFMSELSGIDEAYSYDQIFYETQDRLIKNGLYKSRAGDVILKFKPGWYTQNGKLDNYSTLQAVSCPLIFYGAGLKSQNIDRTIDATEIASGVAYIMRIRSPNSVGKNTLFELRN